MTLSAALWQQLFVDLTVSVTIAVAVTALVSRCLTRPAWRRILWQACTFVLVGIFLLEVVGLNHELAASWQRLIAGSDNSGPAVAVVDRCDETPVLTGWNNQNLDPACEFADPTSVPRQYTAELELR